MPLNIKLFWNGDYLKAHQTLRFAIVIGKEIVFLQVRIELSDFMGNFSFDAYFLLFVIFKTIFFLI